jgi:sugar lactone lactonase YvrE
MATWQPIVEQAMLLGECPLWHPEASALFWVDIAGQAVHAFLPDSAAHRSWPMPEETGCIALCKAKNRLLVALRSRIALLDLDDGSLRTVANAPYDRTSTRFNDGRCDSHGRFWVGTIYEPRDAPRGSLYCLNEGLVTDRHLPVTTSNGLAFSPDGTCMYHADTREHRISAFDFDARAGVFSNRRTLIEFSKIKDENYGGRPDGATVDAEGNYWCAMFEGGTVLKISPAGEVLARIPVPVRCPTMVAFGGQGLNTLYVTSATQNRSREELEQYPLSGRVLALSVDTCGVPEHFYRESCSDL